MQHARIVAVMTAAVLLVLGIGCSSRQTQLPQTVRLNTPQAVSPGRIHPAPMAKTAIMPQSAMLALTRRKPMSSVGGLTYSQLPGAASFAAAAPDGSLWVLSTQPAGNDKYIWHYANGTWTSISGLASRVTVAPDGTLYAINSGGGAYSYSNGSWTAFGGGCRDLTVASDGTLYVISNAGGADGAIWHYAGGWVQMPGDGNRIAASWDRGGFYVVNSAGAIYYLGTNGYTQLPGSATALAPIPGGLFVLGFPASAAGNPLYYYDLGAAAWSTENGSGVSISTNGSTLYVIGNGGGIYAAQLAPPSSPIPLPTGTGVGVGVTPSPIPLPSSTSSPGTVTSSPTPIPLPT